MTAYETLAIDFPSTPIAGNTLATVQLIAHDWRADEDWERFEEACRDCAHFLGHVDPGWVRGDLSNEYGLTIEPRRYSAFWSRAAGKSGFLTADGWVINTDVKGGNAGRPARRYRLRASP